MARFVLFLFLATSPLAHGWCGDLSSVLDDLKGIEAEMAANQGRIDALQSEIAHLQGLGKDADAKILSLQSLVEDHAAKVQLLGDRYTQALALAQRLKNDLEFSSTLNLVLGGSALVAVLVAVAEGVVLAGR
jgi:hypothetical protein